MAKKKQSTVKAEDLMKPSDAYELHRKTIGSYQDRARIFAKLTIPFLAPTQGSSGASTMEDNYSQSFLAAAVNNLTAKIVMAILPPSASSFKLEPPMGDIQAMTGGDKDANGNIAELISVSSDSINKEIEKQQVRSSFYEIVRNIMVVGPVIVEKVPMKGVKWHGLESIGAKLDDRGQPIELSFQEMIHLDSLPEGVDISIEEVPEDGMLKLTTFAKLAAGTWTVRQDISGVEVGQEQTYEEDKLPFQYIGWTWTKGDTYHRPFVEQYIGDMSSYNKLSRVLTEGSVISSKTVVLVDPQGMTKIKDITDSPNGATRPGREKDVATFKSAKNFDYQIPMQRMAQLEKNLGNAFLMTQSVQRDAERVTAQEIQVMARELETTLAGIYSVLATKFSKWLVEQVMEELDIKFESLEVSVITGLDALGRSVEAQKLDAYMQRMVAMGLDKYIEKSELVVRYARFDGINTVGLVKKDSQVKQEEEQEKTAAAQQEFANNAGASAGQAVGAGVTGQPQ